MTINILSKNLCSVGGCTKQRRKSGTVCSMHRERWRRKKSFTLEPKTTRLCSIEECESKHFSNGYCNKHYCRWRTHGDPLKVIAPQEHKKRAKRVCSLPDCDSQYKSNGYCSKHYERWKANGNPLVARRNRGMGETPEQRFWSRVAITANPEKCWEWQANCNPFGYGQVKLPEQSRPIGAHRYSYFLAHGKWPEPLCLHSCDNPPCVNPQHLREGTHADNNADMMTRGRHVKAGRKKK